MDLGKLWYAVKPVNPVAPMFYVYNTISTRLSDNQSFSGEINSQISEKLKLTADDRLELRTLEPQQFFDHLTEDDKKLEIDPKPQVEECEHGNGD